MVDKDKKVIRAVIFDLDGTLLDTEPLSDKAIIQALGTSLPEQVRDTLAEGGYLLPWELKKQIVGLRGSEWVPMVIRYAKEHWNVISAEDESVETDLKPCPPWYESYYLCKTSLEQLLISHICIH